MIYICLDMIKPSDLDYNSQAFSFDSASFKGVKLTNVLRSLSRATNNPNETIKNKIESLEKLAGLCNYGDKFCHRVKLDFRLAYEVCALFNWILRNNSQFLILFRHC